MPEHTYTFRVPPGDIDRQRHLNNVAVVRYVQDAAAAHWLSLAPAELTAAVSWVVRRHEIDYHKPGFEGDELLVRTWVGEPTAATWERFTEIARPADAAVLVTARTVWVMVDAATGRPRRIDAAVKAVLAAARPVK